MGQKAAITWTEPPIPESILGLVLHQYIHADHQCLLCSYFCPLAEHPCSRLHSNADQNQNRRLDLDLRDLVGRREVNLYSSTTHSLMLCRLPLVDCLG